MYICPEDAPCMHPSRSAPLSPGITFITPQMVRCSKGNLNTWKESIEASRRGIPSRQTRLYHGAYHHLSP